ncbi:hypothetical protein CVT26_005151 [Gymnopilus dilepis]|uniref:Uncharacterized protein n=1 Tax=Gymnopilus dilepis TaxID=231916 RepID=A0A409WIY0_9AGAR|nr:hypothetical protein CVT26_005151 [Gymnopilus dilepis]
MSTSTLPSTWEEPRQFSLPLPFDPDLITPELLLACSSTHVALGHSNRIYVYSSPTFDLVHVLGTEDLSNQQSFQIHGEILVVKCRNNDPLDDSTEGCCLYFWDLSSGLSIGTVVMTDYYYNASVSIPETESVDREENGERVQEEWPKIPTLIVCSRRGLFLRIYSILRHSVTSNSASMELAKTISPIHGARHHASMRRTAVTGGDDATIRVWDIVTGECRMVLIGHRSCGESIHLDETRICSSSNDHTARIWDRHSGDCLHILNVAPFYSVRAFTMDATPSHLVTKSYIPGPGGGHNILIWDSVSGTLAHRISDQKASCLGPILRSGERTVVTWEVNEDSGIDCLKIWDMRSGRVLASYPNVPRSLYLRFRSHDRFLVAVIEQDKKRVLMVWNFAFDRCSEDNRLEGKLARTMSRIDKADISVIKE